MWIYKRQIHSFPEATSGVVSAHLEVLDDLWHARCREDQVIKIVRHGSLLR